MPLLEVNGTALHYHVKGNGTPLVCIHPPLLTSEVFNYQMSELSDEFRLVAFDIRGHGLSAPSRQPITYPLIVEDMIRLTELLGLDKCWLCGYFTGASVALEALLTAPAKFAGAIVISGMPEMNDWYNRTRVRLALAAARAGGKGLLSAAVSYGNADLPITYRNLKRAADLGDIANILQYFECSLSYSSTRLLGHIRQPVLLVFGQKDRPFMRYARLLKQRLPNAELHLLPGAGHQLPTKAKDQLHPVIRQWLRSSADHPGM